MREIDRRTEIVLGLLMVSTLAVWLVGQISADAAIGLAFAIFIVTVAHLAYHEDREPEPEPEPLPKPDADPSTCDDDHLADVVRGVAL